MTQTFRSTDRSPTPAGVRRTASPVVVSCLLCVLLAPAIGYGLLADSAYRGYPYDMVLTSRAQDVFTALVLPVLVGSAVRARRGSLPAHIVWLGLLFYLAYSYAIYLIGWPQNRVFLLYVLVVTTSAAGLLDGLARVDVRAVRPAVRALRTRALGWFLVVVGVLFTGLWLSDVAPSTWGGRAPAHLGVGGTPYAVYVLDLTLALPVLIAAGVLLIKRHPMSVLLGGVVLVKVLTLFTALWLGVLAQLLAGQRVTPTADMVPSALLLLVPVLVLLRARRRLLAPDEGWLRSTLWPPVEDAAAVSRDRGPGT